MENTTIWIIGGGVIVALITLFVVFVSRYSKLAEDLGALESRQQSLVGQSRALQAVIAKLESEKAELNAKCATLAGFLDTADRDNEHYKAELTKRPLVDRKVYRILTVGMKATGKSSLTLKWANPLVDLGTIEGTKMERYERTVSQVRGKDTLIEHVFEVHDWGGEHIVDAQEELVMGDIHGILMVVDLGGRDARQVEQHRIVEQMHEFNPQALKFFLTPKIVASCKTIVLFINKSDLIPGTPAQVEAQAQVYYSQLIDSLHTYTTHIDVKVMVGSASFGHSTHILFSHFVEHILPKSAYDQQLLQRIKSGEPRKRTQTITGSNGARALPPQQLPPIPQHALPQAAQQPPHPPALPVPAEAARPNKGTVPLQQSDDDSHGMEQTVPLMNRMPMLAKKRTV